MILRLYMINQSKSLNVVDLDKQNLEKKIEDVDKKTPDTSKFIETQDFDRLTKIILNARTSEASKTLQLKIKYRLLLIQEQKIEKK